MSTLRLEPARVGTLTPREGEGRWYGFDLQLAIFDLSVTVVGLLMAFTNSADDPLRPGSIFTRGLIWLSLAVIIFVASAAADHHWLRTFAWPIYGISFALLVLTLLFGSGLGGVSRWVSVFGLQFQFSEVAKILLAVVLAHYLATREARIEHQAELIDLLTARFRTQPRAEWCRRLEAQDVPHAPMYATDEVPDDPQAKHLQLFIDTEHPAGGRWTTVRSPVSFDGQRALQKVAAPAFGQPHADRGHVGFLKGR